MHLRDRRKSNNNHSHLRIIRIYLNFSRLSPEESAGPKKNTQPGPATRPTRRGTLTTTLFVRFMSVSRLTTELTAPAKAAVRSAAIVAAIAAAFSLPHAAHAQATDNSAPAAAGTSPTDTSTPSAGSTLPAVRVSAEKEPLPGDLEPTFGGGQVARGSDFGILGQQKNIDVPFSMTTYTAKLIEDQQAR
ncbi:MAG TPA: hypothetical protein VL405_07105, partial [Sphingomonas sp.]|nr:hypothetical protein [Sphingomonas sp.]